MSAIEKTVPTAEESTTDAPRPNGAVADPVRLPAISDLPDSFESDGSKISDKAAAEKLFSSFAGTAKKWIGGYRAMRGATAIVCELSYDLRALCLRKDGKPDWAGTTRAYIDLYGQRIGEVLTDMGLNRDERTQFASAVRRYDADNDFRRLYIARKLAGASDLGVKAEDIKPGVELPAKLATALRKEAEGQTITKANGETDFAPGFSDPKTYAITGEKIGQKKAAQRAAAADPAKTTPTVAWAQIRADIVKRDTDGANAGKLHVSGVASAEELHRLVSVFAVALVGADGEKVPAIDNRAKTIGALKASLDTLTALLSVIEDKKNKGEVLTPTLWTEQ